jgi:hypothetical protein
LTIEPWRALTADELAAQELLRAARPGHSDLSDSDRRYCERWLARHRSNVEIARRAYLRAMRRREVALEALRSARSDLTEAVDALVALGRDPQDLDDFTWPIAATNLEERAA